MAYAVVVTFQTVPGQMAAFLDLMIENAKTSLAVEAGCQQFDVATDPDRPNEVFLYERYNDRAAFDAHLKAAHFIAFDAASTDMIADKQVSTYAQVQP